MFYRSWGYCRLLSVSRTPGCHQAPQTGNTAFLERARRTNPGTTCVLDIADLRVVVLLPLVAADEKGSGTMAQSSASQSGRRGSQTGGIMSRKLPARLQRVQRQFGKRIRTLRQNRGLTSEQLAKECGVTTVKMSKIEDGQVNVALSTMINLSKRLATSLAHLFEGIK